MATNIGFYYYKKEGPNGKKHGPKDGPIEFIEPAWTNDLNAKNMTFFLDSGRDIHGEKTKEYFNLKKNTVEVFQLQTAYPGLLIGSGYPHYALNQDNDADKNAPKDFQLGFFFDHTTGLPMIPGSTIKGILKSMYPKSEDRFSLEKYEYIAELLPNELKEYQDEIMNDWDLIFFARKQVFFDAVPIGLTPETCMFEDDYITPHPSPFENPVPLRFLKVAPGILFRFSFLLNEYKSKTTELNIKPGQILGIFKKILLDSGIGAKRNAGFGTLVEQNSQSQTKNESVKTESVSKTQSPQAPKNNQQPKKGMNLDKALRNMKSKR